MKSLPSLAVKMDADRIAAVNINRLSVGKEITFTTTSGSIWYLIKTDAAQFDDNNKRVTNVLVETDSSDFLKIASVGLYSVDFCLEVGVRFGIHFDDNGLPVHTSSVESIQIMKTE